MSNKETKKVKEQVKTPKEDEEQNPSSSKVDQENAEETEISVSSLIGTIAKGYNEDATDSTRDYANKKIRDYLIQEASKSAAFEEYNVLILFDNSTLVKGDADNIYNAITDFDNDKPLLLILYSTGGSAASAYLIGKLCQEYSNDKFIVTVPRYAKSAATLICCGAKEIHLGSLSELGPIDPQINKLPALGLKNSIEHIAELVKIYPESSEMFAKYLNTSLDLIDLGYYERVAESAMQYAEKLLTAHKSSLPASPKEIAYQLVYKYKDHSFVIDKSEAELIFGEKIIQTDTEEYNLANILYKKLDLINRIANILQYQFYFIGSLDTEPTFRKRKD